MLIGEIPNMIWNLLLMIFMVKVEAFELRCPHSSTRHLRAKLICKDVSENQYSCLYDKNRKIYIESCSESANFVRPGQKYIIRGERENTNCSIDMYQPFKFWSNRQTACALRKSSCNEIGQEIYDVRSTTNDNTCYCNYKEGYVFLHAPQNPCFCVPSEEDCTCYQLVCDNNKTDPYGHKCDTDDAHYDSECKHLKTRDDNIQYKASPEKIQEKTFSGIPRSKYSLALGIVVNVTVAFIVLSVLVIVTSEIPDTSTVPKVMGNRESEQTFKVQIREVLFAVAGRSGVGKSTFINTVRDVTSADESFCKPGIGNPTLAPTPYKHPKNPKLIFYNLPGIGSVSFTRKTYVKAVKLQEYDFFLIMFDRVLNNDDLWLIRRLQKLKKPFCLIRSKIDNDIESAEYDGKSKAEVISEIRLRMQDFKKYPGVGMASEVFLITSRDRTLGDWKKLEEHIEVIWNRESKETFMVQIREVLFAVAGRSGAGKSTFINKVRDVTPTDDSFCKSGIGNPTLAPTPYKHPKNPKLIFYNLPGIGSISFTRKTYVEAVKLQEYDFFLIMFERVLNDDDLWLIRGLQKLKKPFCLIRSKIDNDIKSAEHDGKSKAKVISEIRSRIEDFKKYSGVGMADAVFLITSRDPTLGDWNRLEEHIEVIWNRESKQTLKVQKSEVLFAVAGRSGVGKSTFINKVRDVIHTDDSFCKPSIGNPTLAPTPYQHPKNSRLIFYNLPGIGSVSFTRKRYVEAVNLQQYDFFLIMFDRVLNDDDLWLIRRLQKLKKPFCLIRSKIDNDIESAEHDGKSKARVISEIRSRIEDFKKYPGVGMADAVFLITSRDPTLGDWKKLEEHIEREMKTALQIPQDNAIPDILKMETKFSFSSS